MRLAIRSFAIGAVALAVALVRLADARAQHGADLGRVRASDLATARITVARDMVKLPIAARDLGQFEFRGVDAGGREVDMRARVSSVDSASQLKLAAGERVFVAPKALETLDLGRGEKVFGSGRFLWAADGASGATPEVRAAKAYYQLENSVASWNGTAYTTRLLIGLEPESSASAPSGMREEFRVGLAGATLRAEPNPLVVTAFSSSVPLVLSATRDDIQPKVRVDSRFGPAEFEFSIAPEVTLLLSADGDGMLGLGAGEIGMDVQRIGRGGAPLADATPLEISFHRTGTNGSFDPPTTTIAATTSRSPRVLFHAAGTQAVKIHAESNGLRSNEITLELAWPVALLAWAILGGALGGLVRTWKQKQAAPRERAHWLAGALVGALAGPVLVFGLVIGLFQIPQGSRVLCELFAGVVAVGAGFAGTLVFSQLAERLLGKTKSASGPAET